METVKEKVNLKNILAYLQGNARYALYYNPHLTVLLRRHILEQIDYRITAMDSECYNNGSCKLCGCQTTQLQMSNKECRGKCYPKMMNKKEWNKFKNR